MTAKRKELAPVDLDLPANGDDVSEIKAEDEARAETEEIGEIEKTPAKTPGRLEPDGPLLANADAYRQRWSSIQTGFVDEPLYAVESAGRLLAEVLGELASTFATKRNQLESQWRHGGENSTEELRVAFQAYRSFFDRVVST
jgi:hypothetical protein